MTEPSDSPREGRLSDTELSALRTQLVQLLIQQGTIFSNWVKFATEDLNTRGRDGGVRKELATGMKKRRRHQRLYQDCGATPHRMVDGRAPA
jgi:hypothetical protein